MKKLKEFIDELEVVPEGFSLVTNPFDSDVRRECFGAYLENALEAGVDFMLVSEAPSYRGCLITGIPLTDAIELRDSDNAYALGDWLKPEGFPQIREQTSKFVWEQLRKHHLRPLLWNAFPFHPYGCRPSCSDRAFSNLEVSTGRHYIDILCDIFDIDEDHRYALGRPAQFILQAPENHYLHHPAVTGQVEFASHFEEKIAPYYSSTKE